MKLRLYVLRLPDHLSSHPACFPSSKVAEVTVTSALKYVCLAHSRTFLVRAVIVAIWECGKYV